MSADLSFIFVALKAGSETGPIPALFVGHGSLKNTIQGHSVWHCLGCTGSPIATAGDHSLTLIYALAQRDQTNRAHFFNSGFDLASISMGSVIL